MYPMPSPIVPPLYKEIYLLTHLTPMYALCQRMGVMQNCLGNLYLVLTVLNFVKETLNCAESGTLE